MNCSIFEAGHIKVLARVLTTFAKIGDDVYFNARKDGLTLITFNLSKTVYAECILTRHFFTKYEVDEKELKDKDVVTCKLLIKSLLSFFKGHIEKKLRKLKLSYEADKDFIVIEMNYSPNVYMISTIRLMQFEGLQMAIKPNCGKNNIYGNSRNMTQILSLFCPSDKELTMEVLNSKLIVRNYRVGTPRARGSMRSQITLNTHEFSLYDVKNEITITFIFKPFKILTHFAEILGLPFRLNYKEEGRPMTVSATDPTFEVNFILATLNPEENTPPISLETSLSQPSRATAPVKSYPAKIIRPLGDAPISSVFGNTEPSVTSQIEEIEANEPPDTEERIVKKPKTSFNAWLDNIIGSQVGDDEEVEAEPPRSQNIQRTMDWGDSKINFDVEPPSRIDKNENLAPFTLSEKLTAPTSRNKLFAMEIDRSKFAPERKLTIDKRENVAPVMLLEKLTAPTSHNRLLAMEIDRSKFAGEWKFQIDKNENAAPIMLCEKLIAPTSHKRLLKMEIDRSKFAPEKKLQIDKKENVAPIMLREKLTAPTSHERLLAKEIDSSKLARGRMLRIERSDYDLFSNHSQQSKSPVLSPNLRQRKFCRSKTFGKKLPIKITKPVVNLSLDCSDSDLFSNCSPQSRAQLLPPKLPKQKFWRSQTFGKKLPIKNTKPAVNFSNTNVFESESEKSRVLPDFSISDRSEFFSSNKTTYSYSSYSNP